MRNIVARGARRGRCVESTAMTTPWRLAACLIVLAAGSGPCLAQAAAAASAPAKAPAKARPQAAHVKVIEDDNVRIEESRIRGQPRRITVHHKIGPARGYEIIVPAPGKDASQDRGAAGQRAWSLFSF